ncbi:MAG: UPF0175 family protein [Gammaproteobacteria bacterium SHHR-1]
MPATAQLDIPQDLLDSARLSLHELKQELALSLYGQGRLSLGKAHEFADLSLFEFRQLLAFRRIPVHYANADLAEDLETLRTLSEHPSAPPSV